MIGFYVFISNPYPYCPILRGFDYPNGAGFNEGKRGSSRFLRAIQRMDEGERPRLWLTCSDPANIRRIMTLHCRDPTEPHGSPQPTNF